MSAPFTKLVRPHKKDCGAMRWVRDGTWRTPWYIDQKSEPLVTRDRAGGNRGGYTQFLVLSCNSTGCPAQMLVKTDDLLSLVPNT